MSSDSKQLSLSAELYDQLEAAATIKKISVDALAERVLSEAVQALGAQISEVPGEVATQYETPDDEAVKKRLHDLGYLD